MSRLHQEPAVIRLASELKLDWRDPVNVVTEYCRNRIRGWVRAAGGVLTIGHLEQLVCTKLQLLFEEVWSDEDLKRIVQKYVGLREPVFAHLPNEFDDHTFAILLERRNAESGAPDRYVAVIDCRGPKGARRFFSRWHEIAHLLTLRRQLEFPFHRSTDRDPVERLMDVIAGEIGFYEPLFRPAFLRELESDNGLLSFATVERTRDLICPDASFQATLSACVRYTPTAVIYLEAGMGLKKQEAAEAQSKQVQLFPRTPPVRKLRALVVVPNKAAREGGLRIDRNMQIPGRSTLYFESVVRGESGTEQRTGTENLVSWAHSDGTSLGDATVYVEARCWKDRVIAILRPIDSGRVSRNRRSRALLGIRMRDSNREHGVLDG